MNTKNIKNRNISKLLLSCIVALTVISCNKNDLTPIAANDDLTAQAGTGQHRDPNDPCVVTYTSGMFGDPVDIIYNNDGDPDSMNYGGFFPMKMHYNNNGQLTSADFPLNDGHYYFHYNGNANNSLPAYIDWWLYGGTQALIVFTHNNKGQITKVVMNPTYLNGWGSYIENYEYNNKGNVTKVTVQSYNNGGILISDEVQNFVSSYDNKKNFMASNHWLKYLLYNSGFWSYDYFRMLSKNNATNFTWEYTGTTDFNPWHASCIYNNQGFANTLNYTVYDMDGITVLDNFPQTSTSTCENSGQRQAQQQPAKTFNIPQSKVQRMLPFTTAKR